MSDGPMKMAPPDGQDAPALDDIILGEDDQTMPLPPAPSRASAAPPTTKDIDALTKAIEAGGPAGPAAAPAVPAVDRLRARRRSAFRRIARRSARAARIA